MSANSSGIPKGLVENLDEGETVLYAVKKRFSIEKPKWLVITNRRVIYFDEKIFGRYEMVSIPYEKLEKMYCRIGLLATRFVLSIEDGGKLELSWMDRESSRKAVSAMYSAIKSIAVEPPTMVRRKSLFSEEITLVKPKEFVMRGLVAQAIQVPQVSRDFGKAGEKDIVALLNMLKELRDAGVLTEEEYNEKKKKILEKL